MGFSNISGIKWAKAEEKSEFGVGNFDSPESVLQLESVPPSLNFVATPLVHYTGGYRYPFFIMDFDEAHVNVVIDDPLLIFSMTSVLCQAMKRMTQLQGNTRPMFKLLLTLLTITWDWILIDKIPYPAIIPYQHWECEAKSA